MGTQKWAAIKAQSKATPESLAKAEQELNVGLRSYSLAEIRRVLGITQEQLAAVLEVNQPAISKLERADDVTIRRLGNAVKALGGELELNVRIDGVIFPLHLAERAIT